MPTTSSLVHKNSKFVLVEQVGLNLENRPFFKFILFVNFNLLIILHSFLRLFSAIASVDSPEMYSRSPLGVAPVIPQESAALIFLLGLEVIHSGSFRRISIIHYECFRDSPNSCFLECLQKFPERTLEGIYYKDDGTIS